jgi:hypothetical protein
VSGSTYLQGDTIYRYHNYVHYERSSPAHAVISAAGSGQLATYAIPADESVTVEVKCTVANRTSKLTSSFWLRFVAQNNGGVGSDAGTFVDVAAPIAEAGLSVTLDRSGTTVRLNYTTPDADTREFRWQRFVYPSSLV